MLAIFALKTDIELAETIKQRKIPPMGWNWRPPSFQFDTQVSELT